MCTEACIGTRCDGGMAVAIEIGVCWCVVIYEHFGFIFRRKLTILYTRNEYM